MRKNSTQGFTVIELMIVVAVIGILAVALLPNLTGARNSANAGAIESVLTRASQAQEMFYSRCNRYFTDGDTAACDGDPNLEAGDLWTDFVAFNEPSNITVEFVDHSSGNITANYCVQAFHSAAPEDWYHITLGQEPLTGECP